MSQLQKQYNEEIFKKDLKKLKMISKKQNVNSLEKYYETHTVFNLRPSTQINKKFMPALQQLQKSKHNENYTFVRVNKPEITKPASESFVFQNKNMVVASDIKMPIYQNLHFHLNLGIVQNRQSPAYFVFPYLKYYYDEKTLFKFGYFKSRSNHVQLSAYRNIYADIYLGGEVKFGDYMQGIPLSQKTFRFIRMNTNRQLYVNYGDLNSIGYQHQIWKKGNYKGIFNLELNDFQFENPSGVASSLYLRTQFSKRLSGSNISLNLQTNNSLVLQEQELNATYKINSHWKIKFGVQIQTDTINIIAGFRKNNFEVSLPLIGFQLSTTKIIAALGLASVLAAFGFSYYKKNKAVTDQQGDEKYKQQIEEKVQKRKNQINLIQFQSSENNQYQINRNGLVIIEGYYGNSKQIAELKSSANRANYLYVNKETVEIIDVTIPLRFFLNKKGLFIQTLNKENLIGFFNPCRDSNTTKSILIKYSINNEVYDEVYFDDKDIMIPVQN